MFSGILWISSIWRKDILNIMFKQYPTKTALPDGNTWCKNTGKQPKITTHVYIVLAALHKHYRAKRGKIRRNDGKKSMMRNCFCIIIITVYTLRVCSRIWDSRPQTQDLLAVNSRLPLFLEQVSQWNGVTQLNQLLISIDFRPHVETDWLICIQ